MATITAHHPNGSTFEASYEGKGASAPHTIDRPPRGTGRTFDLFLLKAIVFQFNTAHQNSGAHGPRRASAELCYQTAILMNPRARGLIPESATQFKSIRRLATVNCLKPIALQRNTTSVQYRTVGIA